MGYYVNSTYSSNKIIIGAFTRRKVKRIGSFNLAINLNSPNFISVVWLLAAGPS